MKYYSSEQLNDALVAGTDLQLVDVREVYEVESGWIGGLHIPMNEIKSRRSELRLDVPVVIYCRSGKRAAAVAHLLQTRYGFDNIYCLKGGIEAFVAEVNPMITVYA